MNLSGGNGSAGTTDLISRIGGLKQDVDILLQQLSEGEYLSVDTFANNWIHLTQLYSRIQEHMSNRALMDKLVHSDLLLAADLLAVGRMIAVMDNFLRCAVITR
ncbi:hypothetical protein [Pantoea sp. GD03673]|uniref:hypothetical protein n=1 Tax=Pantoea sp. GD03673 TaxID=2975364 RepID=UPI00244B2B3B|nr:hypothetical protein [Pantoea sp. GD03673]MDH2065686.1 hypothetical protein [Pantoea sp. GD03673]